MQGATPASLLPDFDGNKSCILSGYIISVRTTKMNLRCPDLTLLQRASFEKTAWKERKWSGPHGASPLHGSPEPALPDPSVTPRRPCRVSSRTSCLQTLAESGGPVGDTHLRVPGHTGCRRRTSPPGPACPGEGGHILPRGLPAPARTRRHTGRARPGGSPGMPPQGSAESTPLRALSADRRSARTSSQWPG